MKTMRAVLLAAAVGMSSVIGAAAQQPAAPSPEALAVAKELISLMSGDMISDMVTRTDAQAWPSIEQGLRGQYPQIDAETAAELRAEFGKLLRESIIEGMNDAPAIYAHYLTVQEMRDIQAFYRTPTGAKTVKLMPQIMGEVMGNLAPRMQGTMQRINVAFTTILQKHGFGPK
jgi:uncharacterized protein